MAASALDDAVRPPSKVASTVHIWASAPVMCPTSASASASRRRVMPAAFMMAPTMTKKGTASSGYDSVGADHLLDEDVERDIAVDEEEGRAR